MRILIISHTEHFRGEDGRIYGWGPTIREINHYPELFEEVVHIAPLHPGPPPASALPYNDHIRYIPVQPAGGPRLIDKLGILAAYPRYLRLFYRHFKTADLIHIRCPANISLAAQLLAEIRFPSKKRWIKYAGNWNPPGKEAISYRLQRFLCRHSRSGMVSVNGSWPDQKEHIHTFVNPCLTQQELEKGRQAVVTKPDFQTCRLIFIGRMERAKGVYTILDALTLLEQQNIAFHIDFIGAGPALNDARSFAAKHGKPGAVINVHGPISKEKIPDYLGQAHFMLLPSTASEGWPKVLSEAMAFGTVPIVSAVSSMPAIIRENQLGTVLAQPSGQALAEAILTLVNDAKTYLTYRNNGPTFAAGYSYDAFLENLDRTIKNHYAQK